MTEQLFIIKRRIFGDWNKMAKMAKLTIALMGTQKLMQTLKKIRQEKLQKAKRAMKKATLIVERDAIIFAPRETGHLKNHITSRVKVMDRYLVKGTIGTNVEYAPFQEFGTHGRMKFTPFLRPAIEKNRETIKRIFGKNLKADVKTQGKK